MKDLLNEGKDIHRWFAAVLTGIKESDITSIERKQAKACNFGFPGGLGISSFLVYIKTNYGITMTEDEAKVVKSIWLDTFPEMELYLQDSLHAKYDFRNSPFLNFYSEENENDTANMACNVFKRIIGGKTKSLADRSYSAQIIKWVFEVVLPAVAPKYSGIKSGSLEIKEEILKETVITKSGRIRSNCSYTEARNTPFQGLTADGAKIALYSLIRQNYKVVNFIHDEFIIEVPITFEIEEEGKKIKTIIIDAMKTVVPDVKINVEMKVSNCWGEPTDPVKKEMPNTSSTGETENKSIKEMKTKTFF